MALFDNSWYRCYSINMLDKLKTILTKKQKVEKSDKDIATEKGEPYIKVLDTNVKETKREDGKTEIS